MALENELDRAAAAHPHLPAPGVHRVNRTEYANAIRSLLALDIDAAAFLPADDSSYGFDNVASGLEVSPALVEGYVDAASKISRLALGHETAPARKVYHVREDYSQEEHIEGLPFGTRGGMLIHHYFPADGEYAISWDPVQNHGGRFVWRRQRGRTGRSVDRWRQGKGIPHRQGRADRQPARQERSPGAGESGRAHRGRHVSRHHLRAECGSESPLSSQHSRRQSDRRFYVHAAGELGHDFRALQRRAPAKTRPAAHKIFICQPTGASRRAAVRAKDPYHAGAPGLPQADHGFRYRVADEPVSGRPECGRLRGRNRAGVEFILAHPEFVFRAEDGPANVKPGQAYRISDLELASRLAFFFWSSGPDDELIRVAAQGKLRNPGVLEQQIRRMLADPRTHELVKNFAGQWLQLRVMQSSTPEGIDYPDFDDNLRQAFRTEAEMFFESIVREDRSIIDLLNGDYTFVNERLAAHYGIPNVYGSQFRRVKLDGDLDVRRGLLGKGGDRVSDVGEPTGLRRCSAASG